MVNSWSIQSYAKNAYIPCNKIHYLKSNIAYYKIYLEEIMFIDAKELSKRTGLGKRHIEKMRLTGTGPIYMKVSSRKVIYKWDDVIQWLESKKQIQTDGKRKKINKGVSGPL